MDLKDPKVRSRILPWAGRKDSEQTPPTHTDELAEVAPSILQSVVGQPPPLKIPYPRDAGLFAMKPGDVIMTRAMYDFLTFTISALPMMPAHEMKAVCNQLSADLKELVK